MITVERYSFPFQRHHYEALFTFQMLEPETFLPLDYIQAKPLKERLRNINNPKGVKLLYDVLQYEPLAIKRAVLFVTNNALVCETPDDAMKVAYEMEDGQR